MSEAHRPSLPVLGGYEILGVLGSGGMAEIFLGRQISMGFDRPVVIKRVLPHLTRQATFRDMFLDEAGVVARVRHPAVVQIFDFKHEDGELLMVMEYIEGEDLGSIRRRLTRRDEALPYQVWAYVMSEVCAGLHAAHRVTDESGRRINLVHRDINPSNVLVTYDGEVKIIDFGIAKSDVRRSRTEAGQVKGVYAYMAPEQAEGRAVDPRSDIFSLAILLYEFTTGHRLFKRGTDMLTMQAVCTEPVTPPSSVVPGYPKDLEAVVMRGLERDPALRYQSALEMRRDLLKVSNTLEGFPEEILKVVMQAVFEDRIELKRDVLSGGPTARARDPGDSVIEVPMFPAHTSTLTPSLEPQEEPSQPGAPSIASLSYASTPRPRRRSKLWVLLAAALASAIVSVGLMLLDSGPPPAPDRSAVAAPAKPAPPPPAPPPVPVQTDVEVALSSEPAGAAVQIAGRAVGRTPLEVSWPKGEAEVEVRLTLDGHEDWTTTLVPDRDVGMSAALRPTPPPKRTSSSRRRSTKRSRAKREEAEVKETKKKALYRRFD